MWSIFSTIPAQQLAQANSVFQLNLAINNFLQGMANLVKDPANGGTAGPSTVQQVAHLVWNFSLLTRAALLGLVVQLLVYVLTTIGGVYLAALLFLPAGPGRSPVHLHADRHLRP